MIEEAGLGVAYRAKPVVAAQADCRIDHADLTALLYFQGYAAEDRLGDLTGQGVALDDEAVGAVGLEARRLGHAAGEEGEAARHQHACHALGPQGLHQGPGARVEHDPLVIAGLERRGLQALQHAHPLAQGALKADLAAHGALGDGGDLVLDPGEVGQFVEALAGDDGGVHVGHEQGLAAALGQLHGEVDRQALQRRVDRRLHRRHGLDGRDGGEQLEGQIEGAGAEHAAAGDLGGQGLERALRPLLGGEDGFGIGGDEGEGQMHGCRLDGSPLPFKSRA